MKFDPEHHQRRKELALAKSPQELAYLNGRHDGIDYARKQVAWILAVGALLNIIFHWI